MPSRRRPLFVLPSSPELAVGVIAEIDRRKVAGNGGEVCWELDEGQHVVTVIDEEGTVQARFFVADGGKARDLFEHPFASESVPNPFEPSSTEA